LFAIEDKFQSRMALFIHNECLFVCWVPERRYKARFQNM
jgi:hypothetical protein